MRSNSCLRFARRSALSSNFSFNFSIRCVSVFSMSFKLHFHLLMCFHLFLHLYKFSPDLFFFPFPIFVNLVSFSFECRWHRF
eukprot:UN00947